MNKILNVIKNILLTVNLLFVIYFIRNANSFAVETTSAINFLLYIATMLILLILEVKKIRRKDNLRYDNKYNTIYILVELITLFIIIRNFTDPNLFLTLDNLNNVGYGVRSLFIVNNYPYLNSMNIGLIIYYFINRSRKN